MTDKAIADCFREFAALTAKCHAENIHQMTARRSYQLWEDAGSPDGRDKEFWLKAEKQLFGGHKPQSS